MLTGAIARADLLASVMAHGVAILLIAASFASYAPQFSPVGRWQADTYDPADYRFVAEHFWHVPFAPNTYGSYVSSGWDSYLKTVPFRGIGLGTFYLVVAWFRIGHAPSTTPEVLAAGIAFATFEKLLLAASLLTVFVVVRKRWGTATALFTLAITVWPSHFWRITDDFEAEPVHRIIFLLAFACTMGMTGRKSTERLTFMLLVLFICAAHLKVQWYVGAILLLPAMLFQFRVTGVSFRASLVLCAATASIPLSVVAVNWIGWRTTSLSPGIGLHVNLKYGGDVLREFSQATAGTRRFAFADPERQRIEWWNIYVGPDVSRQDYEAFDRYARAYVRAGPGRAVRALGEGLALASTVPGIERVERGLIRLQPLQQPWSTVVRCADVAVWTLLVLGLAFNETRLPCALGLVLWIVPAIGHVFSLYEPRYHLPMAGLGASAGASVLAHVMERRGFRRLLAGKSVVQ